MTASTDDVCGSIFAAGTVFRESARQQTWAQQLRWLEAQMMCVALVWQPEKGFAGTCRCLPSPGTDPADVTRALQGLACASGFLSRATAACAPTACVHTVDCSAFASTSPAEGGSAPGPHMLAAQRCDHGCSICPCQRGLQLRCHKRSKQCMLDGACSSAQSYELLPYCSLGEACPGDIQHTGFQGG